MSKLPNFLKRITIVILVLTISITSAYFFWKQNQNNNSEVLNNPGDNIEELEGGIDEVPYLTIEALRRGDYPGSEIAIEQTLTAGSNYKKYVASYKSEGLKIYGLLTVPNSNPPEEGFPAIIFNHGYISPNVYRTTEKYIAYQDAFARNGYVTFKSDYRGHGNSEGEAVGGYGSNNYTIDIINATRSIKNLDYVNDEKIGMWGHSMGGFITLRTMVATNDVKAGVIWGGVVASYPDLINNWRRRSSTPPPGIPTTRRRWREELTEKFGTPENNPEFWNSISSNSFLSDLSGPIQLHHGNADSSVPVEFSRNLEKQIKNIGKTAELYEYQGDDHNISGNLSLALSRAVEFFDKYLK